MSDDRCDLLCLDLPKAERLRQERLDEATAVAVASRAKALADPTRVTIAAALAAGEELCVCDLAWVDRAGREPRLPPRPHPQNPWAGRQPPRGQDGALPPDRRRPDLLGALLVSRETIE